MNCSTCIKINSLPSCLTGYGEMLITNLQFLDTPGAEMLLKATDLATRQVWYLTFTEGEAVDLSTLYPLMNHWYKLEFFSAGVPSEFTLTNPDDTTVTGCCIEFLPDEGLDFSGSEYIISTTSCIPS